MTFRDDFLFRETLDKVYMKNLAYWGLKNEVWICNNGNQIKVSDMSSEHLDNIIKMIDKKPATSVWGLGIEWRRILISETFRRGVRNHTSTMVVPKTYSELKSQSSMGV